MTGRGRFGAGVSPSPASPFTAPGDSSGSGSVPDQWTVGAVSSPQWRRAWQAAQGGSCSSMFREIAGSSISMRATTARPRRGVSPSWLSICTSMPTISTSGRTRRRITVQARYEDASRVEPPRPLVQKEFGDLPSVAVEEVKAMLDSGKPVQIIDARPRSYVSRQQDIMDGAVWRDPERIHDWIGKLSKSDPVVVFCAYGFHVGCKTAIALREAGFDAKYMKGGHSAWKAIGGPIKLYT